MGREEETSVELLREENRRLREQLSQVQAENQRLHEERTSLVDQVERSEREKAALRERLQALLRRVFGPRSEKIHPDQLLLFGTGTEEPSPPAPATVEKVPDDECPPRKPKR